MILQKRKYYIKDKQNIIKKHKGRIFNINYHQIEKDI